jgi:hypothetical protein
MKILMLLPAVVSLLYTATAIAFIAKGKPAWAVVYLSYAAANIGLILAAKG